jgi:hypothetical protein
MLLDHKVLHNKIKRTPASYIEICYKLHQIHTKSLSHSFKRDPSYKWKDPCKSKTAPDLAASDADLAGSTSDLVGTDQDLAGGGGVECGGVAARGGRLGGR